MQILCKKSPYFSKNRCMNFYNVEILLNGGGTMKNKFSKLIEKNGFLLFLFICVCIVAVGTIFVSTRSLKGIDENVGEKDLTILENEPYRESANYKRDSDEGTIEDMELKSREEIEAKDKVEEGTKEVTDKVEEGIKEAREVEGIKESEKIKEVKEAKTTEKEKEETVEVALTEEEKLDKKDKDEKEKEEELEFVEDKTITLVLPVEGDVKTEFTKDTLIYSETLEEWTSHLGIDIAAKEGTMVKAAMDGTVKKVYEDKLWGKVIIIDHGNGLETKYANLSTTEMVKEGLKVKKGDPISGVGKSATIEMMMEPHIHFEVIKDGKMVDPSSISK